MSAFARRVERVVSGPVIGRHRLSSPAGTQAVEPDTVGAPDRAKDIDRQRVTPFGMIHPCD
jgi:hypothetical protein